MVSSSMSTFSQSSYSILCSQRCSLLNSLDFMRVLIWWGIYNIYYMSLLLFLFIISRLYMHWILLFKAHASNIINYFYHIEYELQIIYLKCFKVNARHWLALVCRHLGNEEMKYLFTPFGMAYLRTLRNTKSW